MHTLTRANLVLAHTATHFAPHGTALGIGRSLLALSTASVLAFSPDSVLFVSVDGRSGIRCDGVRALSLWCIAGSSSVAMTLSRAVTLAVLVVVAAGYRPRWTAVPHWFVTFSFAASMTQPNGGDHVAQIITMLLIPVCLADRRRWHWSRSPNAPSAAWRGAAYASIVIMRLQIAIIYGQAAITKLFVDEWRDGTAMYSILRNPEYGLPPTVLHYAGVDERWLICLLTWGTLVVELTMAISILGNKRMRLVALTLAVMLHVAIGVSMGLFSFAIIMVAAVTLAQCDGRLGWRQPTTGVDTSSTSPEVLMDRKA